MRSFLLAVLFSLLLVGVCGAAGKDKKADYKNWGLRCEKDSICVLEQRVFLEGVEKGLLVHISFQYMNSAEEGKSSKRPWAMISAPLEVRLDSGIELRVDARETFKFPFHHCRSTGCVVFFPLDAALRRDLEAGREAWVTFRMINGKEVGVPIALDGLKSGLAELTR